MVSVMGDCEHVHVVLCESHGVCSAYVSCTLYSCTLHLGPSGFHAASASWPHSVLHHWNPAHEDEEKPIPTRSGSHSTSITLRKVYLYI